MDSHRSIEIKVGILILVALGLLGGFVVVMGGLSLESTYTVYVDFDNPGGLKTGAPVRIAGVNVGRVDAIEFRGGKLDPKSGDRTPLIRVTAHLEDQFKDSIYENSQWFVTTQGVLGEMFLGVDPGTPDYPVLEDGAVVDGLGPPRLDLLLSEAYELLHRAYVGISENEAQIRETFDGLHSTLQGTGRFFDKHEGDVDEIVDNVKALTREANDTMAAARQKYVDNPKITRIITHADELAAAASRDVPPLLEDGRKIARDVSTLTTVLAADDQIARYRRITEDVDDITTRAKKATIDAQALVSRVKRGEGTVGALMTDEAVYDDIQELLRDLKHNPWKILWRE